MKTLPERSVEDTRNTNTRRHTASNQGRRRSSNSFLDSPLLPSYHSARKTQAETKECTNNKHGQTAGGRLNQSKSNEQRATSRQTQPKTKIRKRGKGKEASPNLKPAVDTRCPRRRRGQTHAEYQTNTHRKRSRDEKGISAAG